MHFASQLHDTLGRLADESNPQERVKALDAWRTVFRLRHLFTSGGDLTPYLSRGIKDATSRDGLLWDYGMHHFHLSSRVEKSGLISGHYLLFAIVTDDRTFFDVRKHRDPQDLQWVRQDLLEIVHTNWADYRCAWPARSGWLDVDRRTEEGAQEEERELRPWLRRVRHDASRRRNNR